MKKAIIFALVLTVSMVFGHNPRSYSAQPDMEEAQKALAKIKALRNAEVIKCENIIKELPTNEIDELEKSMGSLDETMQAVNVDIGAIRESQQAIGDATKAMEAVPGIGELSIAINEMNTTLETMLELLKTAEKPAAETVHEGNKFLKKADKIVDQIGRFQVVYDVIAVAATWFIDEKEKKGSFNFYFHPKSAYAAINYSCLTKKLNTFYADYSAILNASNNMLKSVEKPAKELTPVLNSLKKVMKSIDKPVKDLKGFMSKIDPFTKKVKKLERVLKDKVEFKFTVKIGPVDHDFDIKLVSVKTALKGVDAIEKALMDTASAPVVEALKAFGMKKAAREMKKLAEDPFNEAVKELRPYLKSLKIPGISDMEKAFSNVESEVGKAKNTFNKIAQIGIPSFDDKLYKKIESNGISYFEKMCD